MRTIIAIASLALVACHGGPIYQADAAAPDARLTWTVTGTPSCSGDVPLCDAHDGRPSYPVCLLPDGEIVYPRCHWTSVLIPCVVNDVAYEPVCAQF